VFEAQNRADMLVMHAHQRPVPPSKRVGISVPEALEQLILQCLAKNPDKRPQSARELGDRLRALGLHHAWTRARREEWWSERAPESKVARPAPPAASQGAHAAAPAPPAAAKPAAAAANRGPWV
jgi:serine/threonine-protein kinase